MRLSRITMFFILAIATITIPAAAQTVSRGPYIQQATRDSVIVRWRTDLGCQSRVVYGAAPDALTTIVDDATSGTEHVVSISGLSPATTYYYSIGTPDELLGGGDAEHFFRTNQVSTWRGPTRVWVLGDSGTKNNNARAVRDAYETFAAGRVEDVWLMLGDNAYNTGTDAEFQAAVFDMYPKFLRRSALWPTFGNHDDGSADSPTQSGPYYDNFSLPKNAEAGGIPSGTEAYYSFNYGHVHFICLDSQGTSRTPGSAMLTWLDSDLADNTREWVIVYFHHPTYTKGSHNSDNPKDSAGRMQDMRENVLPILEGRGVDLVLTGHSHSYERSFLLDGHYDISTTLTPEMILDQGDGRVTGDGAYVKATAGMAAHEGAIYVVAGSSGQISGGSLDHPAMFISLNLLGSLILDVEEDRLDGTFLTSTGSIEDTFTLVKGYSAVKSFDLIGESATGAPTVVFNVAFNRPVTGVDAADFQLVSAGNLSGATIQQVTGSGVSYQITALTGTGAGALGIRLVDDDSIKDNAGVPLGGKGAGNGNADGPVYTIKRGASADATLAEGDASPGTT